METIARQGSSSDAEDRQRHFPFIQIVRWSLTALFLSTLLWVYGLIQPIDHSWLYHWKLVSEPLSRQTAPFWLVTATISLIGLTLFADRPLAQPSA